MKLPFTLQRLAVSEPATALLLPSHDVGQLLELCARLGLKSLPGIHAVADGFLLKLAGPSAKIFPGTIRLRTVAEDLLIPVDAQLVPALLEDEARGLVRDRGLILMPGGRVLAYAPREPVPLSALVAVDGLIRRSWQPLPATRQWPERIQHINLELPEPPAEELLEAGQHDIGSEEPRPDDSSLGSKVLGQGSLIAGKGMMGLGKMLHLNMLTKLGAKLVQNALSMAPRLTEGLMGRQEAALRWLLQQFREGNLEKALRRALPLQGSGERGPTVTGGFQLPFHNLLYSLGNILGGRSGGGSIWYGGVDIQAQLLQEYRKAAELAAAKGDHRRAAYIYGKLLGDFRSAANVLNQGGLHHDAAILYLTKLGDNLAAARAFAAGGEVDRAVQLYRQAGSHLEAADLLRRAGEEEAAVLEYLLAAEAMVSARQDYLGAGELMQIRAERTDLARAYYCAGWVLRPGQNDLACALKLAGLHATEGHAEPMLGLVDEAERYLRPPGKDAEAGQFFTRIAELAELPGLAGAREELRDRALCNLAGKLRQRAKTAMHPGNLVSDLFGQTGAWDTALVSDAGFALKAALQPPPRPEVTGKEVPLSRIQVGQGLVTAACYAPGTGDILIGFQNGDVYCFRPSRTEVVQLSAATDGSVSALATDDQARMVVALREGSPSTYTLEEIADALQGSFPKTYTLTSYLQTPEEQYRTEAALDCSSRACSLAPLIVGDPSIHVLCMWYESRVSLLGGLQLVASGDVAVPDDGIDLGSVLILPPDRPPYSATMLLIFCSNYLWYGVEPRRERCHWTATSWRHAKLGWAPCIPEGSPLRHVPVAWLQSEKTHLELAGLSMNGTLHWSVLDLGREDAAASSEPSDVKIVAHVSSVRPEGYLAATLVRAGHVAAVSRSQIDWLRASSKDFTRWATTNVKLPGAIACFPSYRTRELIVICRDGVVVRVPVPS